MTLTNGLPQSIVALGAAASAKDGAGLPELTDNPRQNRILSALPAKVFARLKDDLELVTLPLGRILYEAGDSLDFVYFPTTSIISLMFATENGSSSELAMTGSDGLVGIPLVLGGETTTHKVVVQSAGEAFRLRSEIITWELDQGGPLQRLCLCYAQALMTQMAQSVVCNRHHSVDQQLCRWLLLSLDQLSGNELNMTQELIANMLGVRREAVTDAAGKLQAAGLIQYRRGHITILDRPGLEARVCECYGVVRAEYDRLFKLMPDTHPKSRPRPNPASFRQRAEARFLQTAPKMPTTTWDTERLVHELQVHQIELELHNEELRHAYDEADALREKYADIYDFAPIGYFTLDKQGVIVQLNLAGAILLGMKRSQMGRHRFAAAVKPEYLLVFKRFLEDVLEDQCRKNCELVLSATKQRPEAIVRIEAVPDDSASECRMVVVDVTTEKLAEQALELREQYQRALLDNFPFMVWLKDEESRFLAVNAPFAENYGWSSVEAPIGKTDFDITPPEQAEIYRADDLAVLTSGERKSVEEVIEVDGEQRWLETYKSPVLMNGNRIGTVGFSRDITKRKLMEAELRRVAAVDPLTELFTRQHFMTQLEAAQARLQRDANNRAAILEINIDNLPAINSELGHAAGDAVLRLVSGLLRDELRKSDIAGRISREKFAVLMPGSDVCDAEIFTERLRHKLALPTITLGKREGAVSISTRIAAMNADDPTPEAALKRTGGSMPGSNTAC